MIPDPLVAPPGSGMLDMPVLSEDIVIGAVTVIVWLIGCHVFSLEFKSIIRRK